MLLSWIFYSTAVGTLVVVFGVSVTHKLKDYPRFKASLAAYRMFPEALLGMVAALLVAMEVVAIVALLAPAGPGAWIAFVLLSTYTLALTVNLLRGNTAIDCGCGDAPTPISGWLLLRNGALLLLALPHDPGTLTPGAPEWLLVVALVTVLGIFYLIVEQLLANAHLLEAGRVEGG